MDEEIKIAGAGPAGMTAAVNLARAGYKVTVYERHPDVGHRFHGDFQGLENWSTVRDVREELADQGIDVNFFCVPFYGGHLYGPSLEKAEITGGEPLFYLVKRGNEEGTLDQGLKEQALDAGVRFEFGHEVKKLEGRAIVGTGPKGADAIAVGLIFETDHPDVAATIFDDNLAPGGYAYLLVHEGRGTIASCMFRDYRKEKECVEKTVETFRRIYSLKMCSEREFGGFGNFFLKKSARKGEKLYVGENAGFQDFLWGFGMRYAMTSGVLAARSIIEGTDYDRLWRRVLGPRLRTSLVNRHLFDRAGNRGYGVMVARLKGAGDVRGFLRRQYNPSFMKRLIFPLAARSYRTRVRDRCCSHDDCNCIWCRCGKGAAG